MKNKIIPIAFPISLIGLPITCLVLIFAGGLGVSIDDSKMNYIMTMSCVFMTMIFSVTCVLFSFYTLFSFWSKFSNFEKCKYTLISLLVNVLAPYVLAKIWVSDGINPYSFKGKKIIDLFSIFFCFFIFIAISLPMFIAQHNL